MICDLTNEKWCWCPISPLVISRTAESDLVFFASIFSYYVLWESNHLLKYKFEVSAGCNLLPKLFLQEGIYKRLRLLVIQLLMFFGKIDNGLLISVLSKSSAVSATSNYPLFPNQNSPQPPGFVHLLQNAPNKSNKVNFLDCYTFLS